MLNDLINELVKYLRDYTPAIGATVQPNPHAKTPQGVSVYVAIQGIDLVADNPSCPHQRIRIGLGVSSPSYDLTKLYTVVEKLIPAVAEWETATDGMVVFQRYPSWGDTTLSRDGNQGALTSVTMTGYIEVDWIGGSK